MNTIYLILSVAGWIWLVVFGAFLAVMLRRRRFSAMQPTDLESSDER